MLLIMNVDTVKIELINWISGLSDPQSITKLLNLKKQLNEPVLHERRIFGSGKHLIGKIAEDFKAPLEGFKDYML